MRPQPVYADSGNYLAAFMAYVELIFALHSAKCLSV
jgi:hypothetical protein